MRAVLRGDSSGSRFEARRQVAHLGEHEATSRGLEVLARETSGENPDGLQSHGSRADRIEGTVADGHGQRWLEHSQLLQGAAEELRIRFAVTNVGAARNRIAHLHNA